MKKATKTIRQQQEEHRIAREIKGRKSNTARLHNMAEEVVVNEDGGAQSKLTRRPRLIPPEALLRLSEVVGYGALKYAQNNWRKIPYEDHIEHALEHLHLLMNGDKSDDHLGHAQCRLAFAVAMENPDYDFKAWRPLEGKEDE